MYKKQTVVFISGKLLTTIFSSILDGENGMDSIVVFFFYPFTNKYICFILFSIAYIPDPDPDVVIS